MNFSLKYLVRWLRCVCAVGVGVLLSTAGVRAAPPVITAQPGTPTVAAGSKAKSNGAATSGVGALAPSTADHEATGGAADARPAGRATVGSVTAQPGRAPATLASTAGHPPFPSSLAIDFETGEGYLPGLLSGQQGWTFHNIGAVVKAEAMAPSGSKVLRLVEGSWVSHPVSPPVASGLVFVDFYAKVGVAASYPASAQFSFGGAFLSFTQDGSGAAAVLVGNTGELFTYAPTGAKVALDAGSVTAWHRYTLRLNYDSHRWDLYLDGKPIAADVLLAGLPLDKVYVASPSDLPGWLDALQVTADQPLFTDADRDGMHDAWELAHGLDPTVNDRDLDPDEDGLTNIQEYAHGADPHKTDSDDDGLPDGWEVSHRLNPADAHDARQDADGDGLPNLVEYKVGTDIHQAVTESSGIPDAELDFDGDGVGNLAEVQRGTDPTDYYNGQMPVVTPLADYSSQLGPDGLFAVKVTDAAGHVLANAPVKFTTSPESLLTQNRYGMGVSVTIEARSDDDGIARVYVRPAR